MEKGGAVGHQPRQISSLTEECLTIQLLSKQCMQSQADISELLLWKIQFLI